MTELPQGVSGSPDFLREEVESALRNREMPLEALGCDVTPPGLHYLLAHFDIPWIDASAWHLLIDGAVERPASLSLDAIRSRPAVSMAVTLECAGNGRGTMKPRPIGQPWISGAVSTAIWTGTPLWPLLDEAGVAPSAVEVVVVAVRATDASGRRQPLEPDWNLWGYANNAIQQLKVIVLPAS